MRKISQLQSVISVTDRKMIEKKKLTEPENRQESLNKRQAIEGPMVIEREKKGKQRAEPSTPELKKQRMSEETNVLAQESLKRV